MALNYTNPGWTNDDEPYIDADNLNDISDNLEEACETIGSDSMGTTATTITGAIGEHSTKIGSTAMNTTATTLTGAIAEHESDVRKMITGDYSTRPTIPNNSNIHDYKTAGAYTIPTDAAAATMTNLPKPASGELIVVNQGNNLYMTHIYIPTSNVPMIYTETLYNNSTWSEWAISAQVFVTSSSKTASAAGNFSHTFSKNVLVLAAYTNKQDTYVVPYPPSGTGTGGTTTWWFHAHSATTGNAVTGDMTAVIFYMPLV